MSVTMRVYRAPDPDLRAFAVAPQTLKVWLRSAGQSSVALQENWRDVDALIAAGTISGTWLDAARGDWSFAGAADHGAHGLSSVSTRELLAAIDRVTRAEVESYVRRRRTLDEATGVASSPLSAEQLEASTEELVTYLARLRERCQEAVTRGHGLLLALWETA